MDRKLGYHAVFNNCDTAKVGMINFAQFCAGINSFVEVAHPLLEKIFEIMDVRKIGMIDFDRFAVVLKADVASNIPQANKIEDSFIW